MAVHALQKRQALGVVLRDMLFLEDLRLVGNNVGDRGVEARQQLSCVKVRRLGNNICRSVNCSLKPRPLEE